MKRILQIIGILMLSYSTAAGACGSVGQYFSGYPVDGSVAEKERYLKAVPCSLSEAYHPHEAEKWIARALIDANSVGIVGAVIERLLSEYNCLYSLKGTDLYDRLRNDVGALEFDAQCDATELARIYVVISRSGVVLRAGPSRTSRRVAAIAYGVLVKNATIDGDWVHVETHYGDGFIHRALLKRYGI